MAPAYLTDQQCSACLRVTGIETIDLALNVFAFLLAFNIASGALLLFFESPTGVEKLKQVVVELAKEFLGNPKALFVAASIASFFALPFFEENDSITRTYVTWAYLLIVVACASISLWMFWSSPSLRKFGHILLRLNFAIPIFVFILLIWAKSISDETIQRAVGVGPEELATTSNAIAGLYAVILAMVLSSWLFVIAGATATIEFFRDIFNPVNPKHAGSEVNLPIMILGLMFSAISIPVIPLSDWSNSKINEATTWLLVQTAFFEPGSREELCLQEHGLKHGSPIRVRLLGDGEKLILATKGEFVHLPCPRSPSIKKNGISTP